MKLNIPFNLKYIEIDGYNIATQLLGEGENLIVLLHGGGILSPIMEFKAISELLAQNFKVLVIECFGYGLSDNINKERTIENITDEIHRVLSAYQFKKYIIIGHSIAGVYSLFYTNKYPEEVIAFIGIDTSVPKQNEYLNLQFLNVFAARVTRFLRKSKLQSILAKKETMFLPKINTVSWTEDEILLFKELYINKSANDTVLNELQNSTRNFNLSNNMLFPIEIPVLFFLSAQSCKQIKAWEELHYNILQEHTRSKIVVYEGNHFLHYSHPKEIVTEIRTWLSHPFPQT